MKKYLLVFFALLIVSWVKAQGHYDGQLSLGGNVGIQSNEALAFNLNFQKLFKGNYFGLRADLMYTTTKKDVVLILPQQMNFSTYNVGLSGMYSLEKVISHPFYINLFLGANYTNDQLNNQSLNDIAGIEFKPKNENSFGVYGGVEFEYMFTKNIAITLTSLNQFLFKTDFETTRPFGFVGVKYSF